LAPAAGPPAEAARGEAGTPPPVLRGRPLQEGAAHHPGNRLPEVELGRLDGADRTGSRHLPELVGLQAKPCAHQPSSGSCSRASCRASGKGVGSTSNSLAAEPSVTVVCVDRPSIRGLATPASTGVTSPIQREESRGVRNGTGTLGRGFVFSA